MAVVVVVGAQWGDEGKGKIVDLYTVEADVVVRYGGGANAGHTLVVGGEKIVLHLIPSGILHTSTTCVLAQGTVVDPAVLLRELNQLDARGLDATKRVLLSDRAHVVMPHHFLVDRLREAGANAIGTTKRGIGPAYEDKTGRRGIRVGDLLSEDKLRSHVARAHEAWKPFVASLGEQMPNVDEVVATYAEYGRALAPRIRDTSSYISAAISGSKRILLEGAQGTLLDVDHGTYPFVTSSNTIAGGACAGAGIGPTAIDSVIGITKAYATRVGSGPFPTELHGEEGERLRQAGAEFGATTGRPRRCGWIDIPALRYAVRVNGISGFAMTKLDVLSGMDELKICVAYEVNGVRTTDLPYDDLDNVTPIYETMPGWKEDITQCKAFDELPKTAREYVKHLEELAGAKITQLSIGPDRVQTMFFAKPFAP